MNPSPSRPRVHAIPLARLVRADGILCLTLGAAGLVWGADLAEFLAPGGDPGAIAWALRVVGAASLLYGAALVGATRHGRVDLGLARVATGADILWVAATLLLAPFARNLLSDAGFGVLLGLAVVVGLLGALNLLAFQTVERELTAARPGMTGNTR